MSSPRSLPKDQPEVSFGLTASGQEHTIQFLKTCEICRSPAMEGIPRGLPFYCRRHVFVIARIIELVGDKERTQDETRQFVAQAEAEAEKVLGGQGGDQHLRDEEQPAPRPAYPVRDPDLRDRMDNPTSLLAQIRASNSHGLVVAERSFSAGEEATPSLSADLPRDQSIAPRRFALRKGTMKTTSSEKDKAADEPTHSDGGRRKRIMGKEDVGTVLAVLVVGVLIPLLGLNIFLSSVGMRPFQLWPLPGLMAGISLVGSQLDVFLIPFLVLVFMVVGLKWLNKH